MDFTTHIQTDYKPATLVAVAQIAISECTKAIEVLESQVAKLDFELIAGAIAVTRQFSHQFPFANNILLFWCPYRFARLAAAMFKM